MSGITSQQTLEMISKRTHSAHDDIVTKGGQAGGRAYGYRVVHDLHPTAKDKSGRPIITAKRMQIDPVQAVVIKKIFHMFADEGLSTTAIAAQLNAEGVPSPGSTWEGPRPKDEWRREERPHLRIIDDDLWRRARAMQGHRAKTRGPAISKGIAKAKRIGGTDSRYLLGSILRCGSCGARMIGGSRKDYICPGYASGACDNDLRVRRDEVHNSVLEPLTEHLLTDEVIARVKASGEAELRRMVREEEAAARNAVPSKEMKRLDEQEIALRSLALPPAAFNARSLN